MNIAVYPGTFDPITDGHVDVVERASAVFDRIVVGVLANPRKEPLLSTADRIALIEGALAEARVAAEVTVESFDGLTVEFCRSKGARFIVRGLRAIGDFDTELQLAHNNRQLAPEIDTVLFMTSVGHGYISSSLVKEIATFGGDVREMVPAVVAARLTEVLRRP